MEQDGGKKIRSSKAILGTGSLETWVDQVIQEKVQSSLVKSAKSQKSNADTPTKAVVMTDGE